MNNKIRDIYGNEKLLNFFNSAFVNGKIAHAYILEGGQNSGKHTLARHIACLLACNSLFERPCFSCESCNKISEGISPDVIEIELQKDKKTIGVEQIRELRSSVYVKPNEEDVKIYIIGNAEAMTPQAQNVFLKVLEEPPKGVFFFMLCENTANILPTVKSRAPVLKMQVFSDSEISEYLLCNNKKAAKLKTSSPEEFDLIVRISEGRIGEAERLINDIKSDKEQTKHEKAKLFFELLSDSGRYGEFLVYVQNMAKNREELLDVLLYISYAVRDLMAVKKSESDGGSLLFYSNKEYAEKIASAFTAAGVMMIYNEICRTRNELTMNANLTNSLICLADQVKNAANI